MKSSYQKKEQIVVQTTKGNAPSQNLLNRYLHQVGLHQQLTAKQEYLLSVEMNDQKSKIFKHYISHSFGRQEILSIISEILHQKRPIYTLFYGYNNIVEFNQKNEITLEEWYTGLSQANQQKNVALFTHYMNHFPFNISAIFELRNRFQEYAYRYVAPLNEIKRLLIRHQAWQQCAPLFAGHQMVDPFKLTRLITRLKLDAKTSEILKKKIALYHRTIAFLYECSQMGLEQFNRFLREVKPLYRKIEQLRHVIIQANLRLVISIAKRYLYRGLTLEDLIQEGNIGLIKSIDRFDYSKGTKLSTYATWWIKQTICRSLEEKVRTIRLPSHVVELLTRIHRFIKSYKEKKGDIPTHRQILLALKIKKSDLHLYHSVNRDVLSLDATIFDGENQVYNIVPNSNIDTPEEASHKAILSEKISLWLSRLDPKEERVLKLRFGLDNMVQKTLEEIGKEFSLTRERIRQIELSALQKLRRMGFTQEIGAFWE